MGAFDGRVAVVTGGSRGIGWSIADAFAREGADVVIASRKFDACSVAADRLRAEYDVRALPVAFHAARWDDCDRLAETVDKEFGRCDVLVNNAGMSPSYPSLREVDEAYYDKVSGVNLKGPFRLSILLAEQMSDGGAIVNVSTIGSLRPGVDELVYACAKAGLNALTVGLAAAYAPTVRVNALLPGPVETDIASGWSDETRATAVGSMPLARMGRADDFAGPALWLAGADSAFVTGTLIRVDGGLYRQTS
ncbi:SDR family NAD(P)-dependent oxidoreductase [Cryptosporangium sp. NPDC051539]|uniref:SDR family NAD(P)-dependent oxidoreductase n=1 Tax=Cryptosporangium sp. NPDC051539 TaxID=3363962 RepID=UPI0037B932BF